MTHSDAQRWNRRYAAEGLVWLERSPRALLHNHKHLLPNSGLALDAAAGVAANGLYLAQRGMHVIALDISETGLQLALQRAKARKENLEAAVFDLVHPWLPIETFDVIVNFHFLERSTLSVYREALKPGGLLFFETFVKIQERNSYPSHYLESGELRREYQDWDILHWSQKEIVRGENHKTRVTEQLIARKPQNVIDAHSR